MKQSIQIGQVFLSYELIRKNVKHINLRIYPNRSIRVSANKNVPLAVIETFLKSKEQFIERALNHMNPEPQLRSGEFIFVQGKQAELCICYANKNQAELRDMHLTIFTKDPDNLQLIEKIYRNWAKEVCKQTILPICKKFYSHFEQIKCPFPEIRFRHMKSCFGNCRPTKNIITFSTVLVAAPIECIEYVVVHEFAHLFHPNHSKEFYRMVGEILPDWKNQKQLLHTLPLL